MRRTIKAIKTEYKGYRFRSRLEARWAVFFDALGVRWEYEKEGYELPSFDFDRVAMVERHMSEVEEYGMLTTLEALADRLSVLASSKQFYLPDFWLPEYEIWAEVKASGGLALDAIDKAMRLVNCSGYPLIWCMELMGEPLKGMSPDHDNRLDHVMFMLVDFGASPQELMGAASFARSARFEHGEKPRASA